MSEGRTLSHSAGKLVVVVATVAEFGSSVAPMVDETELVVSGVALDVDASDDWISAAVVVVSGSAVSSDAVVHAATTQHRTTDPTNPLVFTADLQASSVRSRAAEQVENNGPTVLFAALGESIDAWLRDEPFRAAFFETHSCLHGGRYLEIVRYQSASQRFAHRDPGCTAELVAGDLGSGSGLRHRVWRSRLLRRSSPLLRRPTGACNTGHHPPSEPDVVGWRGERCL